MLTTTEVLAHAPAPAPAPKGAPRPWWEGRWFVAAMIVLAMVPLIYPPFPPLVDLPGHMGRYYVAAHIGDSPTLGQWYDFHWHPIGNLGVDVLVVPLTKLLGVEYATKLVVMTIPALTVAGLLWVAREVHNRLPPTAAFALPLAYGHPFLYGFVNFALSMALALLALGLWLRLGRLGKTRLRTLLFVPISFVVFFAHTVGWGTMGLLIFSAEAVRQHDRGLSWWRAGLRAAWLAAGLALPVLIVLLWRTEAQGGHTFGWFIWIRKAEFLLRVLRDRWMLWDQICAALVYAVPLFAVAHPQLTLSRNLVFSSLIMTLAFVLLPYVVFGSAYTDMRMVPYMAAIWIIAIRFRGHTDLILARGLALMAVAFMVVRMATLTASLAIAANDQRAELTMLDHVARGSRVAAFELAGCKVWPLERDAHLPAMAIIRREAFSNDQWRLTGASLLTIHYPEARLFESDPSQIVRGPDCPVEGRYIRDALAQVPRGAFDYLWLVNVPAVPPQWTAGWTRIAANGRSSLYRRAVATR